MTGYLARLELNLNLTFKYGEKQKKWFSFNFITFFPIAFLAEARF